MSRGSGGKVFELTQLLLHIDLKSYNLFCRCHGGEGTWLPVALECVGYTKVQVVVDMYVGGDLWESIDANKYPLKKNGMVG